VTRNTGNADDGVKALKSEDGVWYGPAVFDGYVEVDPGTETP